MGEAASRRSNDVKKWNHALLLLCLHFSLLTLGDGLITSTCYSGGGCFISPPPVVVHNEQQPQRLTITTTPPEHNYDCLRPCRLRRTGLYAASIEVEEGTINDVAYSKESLSSLTVKELREILKASDFNQRGVMSRLKLKKDLVDFLYDNLGQQRQGQADRTGHNGADDSKEPTAASSASSPSTSRPRRTTTNEQATSSPRVSAQPISMPKASISSPSSSSKGDGPATAAPHNLKDALFEKVYTQYPPLRPTEDNAGYNNCTGVGEDDIRQTYHPIFANNNNSNSDMDIIFVGTASCTPGVTRGVSCTALRLNWRRRAVPITPMNGAVGTDATTAASIPNGDFEGGTWLFDCGECTQVGYMYFCYSFA